MEVIRTEDLSKEFLRQEKQPGLLASLRGLRSKPVQSVPAVVNLNLSVQAGETIAFIGPNGAGKSTTIKMLTGILHPSSGSAQVLGFTPWRDRQRLAFQIGTVFGQKSQLWYHLPPADSFLLLSRIYELDDREARRRQAELVEWFDLQEVFHVPVRKLSLGQRMRCELAAALLHRPQVIFLDEPTIGLDVVARRKMRELVKSINETTDATVFLTSHDTGDIDQLCRRVIMINHGQVVIDQPMQDLKRRFLQEKVISVRLEQPLQTAPVIEGARVLKHKGAGLKLQLDTRVLSIDQLYMALRTLSPIADINISDPPLEDIIARIYGDDLGTGQEVQADELVEQDA
ncbi:MAG: ABC transporter ATP-binding protein [Bacillota bacterium]